MPHKYKKKTGVYILISDKIDFKVKITRNTHFRMTKGDTLIHQEDIAILNLYALNNVTKIYFKN